ncbi:hypothetical protein AWC27_02560 [Mycobacterium szulgai]|uniref:Uncharacterized protein n=1 Tax=Mycobacterium szulgai TaxID=1787 RepID=A0A1X2EEX0_MYCSZ|nr:hypothetical protein AWC27_02560 [Mycobacterium szulgai]
MFEDSTVPSLVVIEQLSLLTRKRLDASTEPTSEFDMGVTVIDHGMYTLCCVRRRPEAST